MIRRNLFHWAVVLLPVLLFLGCGDSDSNDGGTPVEETKLSDFWTEVEGCALCHAPSGEAADGPDLSTPSLFVSNLVGKKLQDYPNWVVTSDCSTIYPFVSEGDANQSTLMASLVEEHSAAMQADSNCTSSFNYHEVNQVTITKGSPLYNDLVDWINAGAINN